ncbi:MAG TPA: DUF4129 domain-containing protein, partial [Candidatus Saccharimonadales bacterium]|nr:DUF4129 domain-containing protein [Candidatus Saccharimonadales bacterium]
ALGATDRVDWRRNRSWVLLFVGILVVMTAIAVPAAFLLGVPITLLLVAMLGPLVIIATPILDLLGRILLVLLTPLDWIVAFLRSLIHPNPNAATNPTAGIPSPSPLGSPGAAGTAGASILVIAIIAGLALLALIVLIRLSKTSRPSRPRDGGLDERTIDLPELGLHLPAFRRPRLTRRGSPVTATTAYLFFLRDLEGFERLRRRPSEAPGSHARRLRAEGIADPAAALLAADYQLERYALLPLSEAETRRGIARWRRLRDVIHQHGTSSNDEAGPAS